MVFSEVDVAREVFVYNTMNAMYFVLLCSLCLVNMTLGYFVSIDAHAEECFYDKVVSGTKMSLMFEVVEGGFLDIDVSVSGCVILLLLVCVERLQASMYSAV